MRNFWTLPNWSAQAWYTQHMYLSFYWLAMLNCCLNPIVYYAMNNRWHIVCLSLVYCTLLYWTLLNYTVLIMIFRFRYYFQKVLCFRWWSPGSEPGYLYSFSAGLQERRISHCSERKMSYCSDRKMSYCSDRKMSHCSAMKTSACSDRKTSNCSDRKTSNCSGKKMSRKMSTLYD